MHELILPALCSTENYVQRCAHPALSSKTHEPETALGGCSVTSYEVMT